MRSVVIRNIPDETHAALRTRARLNGRSTEAEIRLILDLAVSESGRLKLGTELAEFRQQLRGADLTTGRDRTAPEPADYA